MKTFLLDITLTQAIVYFAINLMLLIRTAYYKPKWYTHTFRILSILLLLAITYKLGWDESMTHHDILYKEKLNRHYFSIMFCAMLALHWLWLDGVAKHRLKVNKSDD